jgi:cysteinyl-tRNA synthetase
MKADSDRIKAVAAALLAVWSWGAAAAVPSGVLYQLQGLDIGRVAASAYPLVVTDYSRDGSGSGEWTAAEVGQLRSGGNREVLAYLSIGEAEDYRYYWQPAWRDDPPAWLGPANPDWPGNYKVRYWDPAWQALLFGSEGAYLDRIVAQGFDGIYLDIVDAYEYWGPDGKGERASAADDMVALVKALAAYGRARRPGFRVYPQNGAGLGAIDPSYVWKRSTGSAPRTAGPWATAPRAGATRSRSPPGWTGSATPARRCWPSTTRRGAS